ncbi:unnamed protein product, partial [Rotaria sp. Silwood1]
ETKLEHTGTYAIKLTNEVRKIELSIELAITERLIEVGKHFIDIIGLENGETNQRYFQLELRSLILDDTGEYSCIYDELIKSKDILTVNEVPIDFEKNFIKSIIN